MLMGYAFRQLTAALKQPRKDYLANNRETKRLKFEQRNFARFGDLRIMFVFANIHRIFSLLDYISTNFVSNFVRVLFNAKKKRVTDLSQISTI